MNSNTKPMISNRLADSINADNLVTLKKLVYEI